MEKVKISFNVLKSVIIIFLSVLIYSCNGQENGTGAQNTLLIGQKKSQILIPSNGRISEVVRMMFQDSKGNIWFGTQSGAFKLVNDSLILINGIKDEFGKRVTIKDITEDINGTIWIGHEGGISSIDGNLVKNYYQSDGLISNSVWNIETDVNGNVWIGTIEGVCLYDGQEFVSFELPDGKMDSALGISSEKMVHNIFEDSKGTIWLCSNAGLFAYKDNTLIDVSEKVGIQTNFVNEIFEDSKGVKWVSTKKGLYKLTDKKATNITEGKIETGKGIGSIAEDKSGKIWFVSNQHYLYSYDGNELKEFQKSEENKGPVVFQIFKDQADRMWMVGYGGAFRLENGAFVNVTKDGPW
jgi:ligand-binding sensor domain-containing protein